MLRIFISYRRDDSSRATYYIYSHLVKRFGKENVFMDVEQTLPGVDFRAKIERFIVNSCDVMLVIIGWNWTDIRDQYGNLRLHHENDPVRIEIEMGLRHSQIRVIPVIVDGASMPSADQLPPSLNSLAFKDAWFLHPKTHAKDMKRLVNILTRLSQSRLKYRIIAIIGAITLIMLVFLLNDPFNLVHSRSNVSAPNLTSSAVNLSPPNPTDSSVPTAIPTSTFLNTTEIVNTAQANSHAQTLTATIELGRLIAASVPQAPTQTCPQISGDFVEIWLQIQEKIGCATGPIESSYTMAQERFDRGQMLWRSDMIDYGQAVVLFYATEPNGIFDHTRGTWQIFTHTPYSGDQTCIDPTIPNGGFGAMWRDSSVISTGLGNSQECFRVFIGKHQSFSRGFIFENELGETYVFYEQTSRQGSWQLR